MDEPAETYTIEHSFDGRRWRGLPPGYRQDGTIVDCFGGVVVQSIGRGRVVYYRAIRHAADPQRPLVAVPEGA